MIGPLLIILAAVAPVEANGPPVRLAPILCPALSDADVRAALGVEIRGRLLGVGVVPATDFLVVSVSCTAENVDLLAVRQGAGSPVRREVPMVGLAADARPRAVAVAIAELLRVDLLRNSSPPVEASPRPMPERTVAVGGGFLVAGYFSGTNPHWFSGEHLRVALESAVEEGSGSWGWGVAFEIDNAALVTYRADLVGAVSVLARRPGARFTPELGLGARIGPSWDYTVNAPQPTTILGGPFASAAIEIRSYWRYFVRLGAEGGIDFGARGGGWASVIIGGGFRR